MSGIIICMPVSIVADPGIPSQTHPCGLCGEDVWISDTMSALIVPEGLIPYCLACGLAKAQTDEDPVVQIHPAQVDGLRETGILDFSRRLVDNANETLRKRRRR